MTPTAATQDWTSLRQLTEPRLSPSEQTRLAQAYQLATSLIPADTQTAGLAIAGIIAELGLDGDTIAAGLLLPLVESELIQVKALEKSLGKTIANLLEGAIRIAALQEYGNTRQAPQDAQTDKLRQMLLTLVEDPRVMLIRLADQLQLLRVAKAAAPEQRRQLAHVTLELFAPLAGRLGVHKLKWEMEDLAFRFQEPETYKHIAKLLEQRRSDREHYIDTVMQTLRQELAAADLNGQVSGRAKHIYSIWNKMRQKRLDFHQLFDTLALRVLVSSISDCYAVLGIIHHLWHQIPEEFDDYIAKPKPNGYQSIHTAVVGPDGRVIEVQIRTESMHRQAELGVAAHWRYKERSTVDFGLEQRITWLRGFLKQPSGQQDLLDQLKTAAFHHRIYVFTPQGQVIDLPEGATPLDFAYTVHTEIGHRCRGAKVDGHIIPLVSALKNGQRVEILTAREAAPSRDWLNPELGYLRDVSSRAKVRRWFKQHDYEQHVTSGREILEREHKRLGLQEIQLASLSKHFHYKQQDDFLAALGRGELRPAQLVQVLKPTVAEAVPSPSTLPESREASKDHKGKAPVLVLGVTNLLTRFAGCCKPIAGEPIIGYISQTQGITIHLRDCANLQRMAGERPDRILEVAWGGQAQQVYMVGIVIEAQDRQGLLRDISDAVTGEKLNIVAVNTLSDRLNGTAHMQLTVDIPDVTRLERLLQRLRRVPQVFRVQRK